MINSFGDTLTENLFNGTKDKGILRIPKEIHKVAKRKLDMIEFATLLEDLKSPPANRLEKLKGHLKGFYSIRINDQWRIIFEWKRDGAHNVQIIDYH